MTGSSNGMRRQCQRLVGSVAGRGQCAHQATWTGALHVGRDVYIVESCDRHRSSLIDAEPLDGNWERLERSAWLPD